MSAVTTMQSFVEAFLEERHRLGFASRSMGHALRSFAAYLLMIAHMEPFDVHPNGAT